MTAWTSDELNKVGKAEELQIASLRRDGTLRSPVMIWVVRLGDDLYVRAVKGRSGWFRGVQTRHEGHIQAGDVEKDVMFVEESGSELNEQIDNAYSAKYQRRYPASVASINSPVARTATIRLVSRETSS
jgi:hypothetical protein